jgi:FkbM family methyltransferase
MTLLTDDTHDAPLLAGRTFIDIGGNIGTTTVLALTEFQAHHALVFEPEKENVRLMRCNLLANGVLDKAEVHATALSDSRGQGVLDLSPENCGDHRLRVSPESGVFDEANWEGVSVPVARFDDLAKENDWNLSQVGLIWIDIQGHEANALAGARSLLECEAPIVLEYWPYGLERAGGRVQLHEIIRENFREVVDLRLSLKEGKRHSFPAGEVDRLMSYTGLIYTDLLLLH